MRNLFLSTFSLIILLIISTFLNSCDSNLSEDIPIENMDQTGPKIEITNLSNLVEVETEIRIKIIDESSITTTIKIDEVEVFKNSDKEFTFTIDPFDFSSGTKNIKITSVNSDLQESVKELTVEFKRLLFRDMTFFSKKNYHQGERFISIHKVNGDLLAFREINSTEDGIFYAPDDLEKQAIIISRYEFGTNISNFITIGSYLDIKMGTVITDGQDTNNPDFFTKEKRYSFQTNGIIDLVSENYNSTMPWVDPSNPTSYELLYSDSYAKEFLVSTSPLIENPIENYHYLIIDDLSRNTYDLEDFKSAKGNALIDIPVNSNFRLNLYGFKSEETFLNHHFNEIYVSRVASDGKVTVPTLEEFEVYQLNLAYSYNRTDVHVFQKGLDKPLEAPKVNVIQNGKNLELVDQYDYLDVTFSDANNSEVVIWSFFSDYRQSLDIPFYEFEIPQKIKTLLAAKSLSLDITQATGDFASLHCNLWKGGNYVYNKEQTHTQPNKSPDRDGFIFRRRLDLN